MARGSSPRTFWRARGPPVEVPMAIRAFLADSPLIFDPSTRLTRLFSGTNFPIFTLLASMTLLTISDCTLYKSREIVPEGLARKSTAPMLMAFTVSSAPSFVVEESITTGTGCSSMMTLSASSPFMTGISISNVTTSGRSLLIFLMASSPLRAVPMTSIELSDRR